MILTKRFVQQLKEMSKLIIMRGLPASGKSTRAKEILEQSGNAVRLNRDLLRTMLHCDKFTGRNEQATTDTEEIIALYFLKNGKNVIIDDTNLNPKTLKRWTSFWPNHEIIDMTDVSVNECIKRDRTREKKVGQHVILRMAMQHLEHMKGENVVICDLDGTLCNIDHRLHFVKDGNRDWKSFFANLRHDTVRTDVFDNMLHSLVKHNAKLVFVSGRPEEYRKETEEWLMPLIDIRDSHTPLFMRPKGDHRPDTEVKAEIYDKLLSKTNVVEIFDDRPSVIRMWRDKLLNVTDVGTGVEF